MPITTPGIVGSIVTNLNAVSLIGTDVPKYANGVAQGLILWVPLIQVVTVDVGTAGTGTNVPLPVSVVTPTLYANLFTGATGQGFTGIYLPVFLNGLANGLTAAFFQMLVETVHPIVGTGTGVATFVAPPASTSMITGFASAGLIGPQAVQAAVALAIGLDLTFASLSLPIVIVGTATPTGASGVGTGKIV